MFFFGQAARPRELLACALMFAVLLGTLEHWRQRGLPVTVVEPARAELPCLSYAPFRHPGDSPFDPALTVTPQQIEADLRLLAPRTGCVRLYGTGHGLDAVPAVAQRLGLRLVLGAWLGRDQAANAVEMQRALALAVAHAPIVERLIVGNEVLLRRELDGPQLARWLDHARTELARAGAKVPVSYADVWEFWLRHDRLREHVDEVTVHILPYWEDDPVAIDHAVAHVGAQVQRLRAHFAPLPVWVGETGWPSAGRQRAGAVPGRVQQARFVREMAALTQAQADAERIDFNLIEAFDQPWKQALEGRVGAHWGLFDAHGREHMPWRGPLVEDPRWWRGLLWGLGGAMLGVALAVRVGAARLSSALAGALFALLLVEPLSAPLGAAGGTGTAAPLLWQLVLAAGAAVLAWPTQRSGGHVSAGAHSERRRDIALMAVLLAAGSLALPIVADPRYRELPWQPLMGAAALVIAHGLLAPGPRGLWRVRMALGCSVAAAAPLLIAREGLLNAQAWALAGALLALGLAAVGGAWRPAHRTPARPDGAQSGGAPADCTATASANSTAGAAQSAL